MRALSSGSAIGVALLAWVSPLLSLNGSLALVPVLVSLPPGIVSLVRKERPRWGLWGVILSGLLLLMAGVAGLVSVGLLLAGLTQNW